jgi:hypothetical protein
VRIAQGEFSEPALIAEKVSGALAGESHRSS